MIAAEWWTYRPSDFIMFSPRLFARLFESINAQGWPLALAFVAGGLWLLLRRPTGTASARGTLAALALAWGASGWLFHWQRFAPINWPAQGAAWLFGTQALLLATAAARAPVRWHAPSTRRRAGLALAAWALLGHPLLAGLFGRPWRQAELVGLAPDPTALATLAALLLLQPGPPLLTGLLWTLTCGWLLASAAMLATIDWPQAWVLLGLLALALPAARRG
ncbi:MAG: DUF6064 family protein [Rubrivivax sp.]